MFSKIKYKLQSVYLWTRFDNFFQLLLSHLIYPKGVITYVWKGNPVVVDGRRQETAGGIHPVLVLGEYTPFLNLLPPSSVCRVLDLGANVGSFAVLLSTKFPALERMVLVEGDHSVLPRLYFNSCTALGKKAKVVHGAVCGTDGVVTFHQNLTSVGSGIAVSEATGAIQDVVESFRLATLMEREFRGETVDICKMDIEGSEYDAIGTLTQSHFDRIRLLIIELHGSEEEDNGLIEKLKGFGFEHQSGEDGFNHRTHGFLNRNAVSN